MQTLYMDDLPLDASEGWDVVTALVESWTRERLGLEWADAGDAREQSLTGNPGVRGRTSLLTGSDGSRLRTWQTRTVDLARPMWAYDVTIWLADDRRDGTDRTGVRVRLGAHALHGRLAELPTPVGAPGVVGGLLRDHRVERDGLRLGHPHHFEPHQVQDLVTLLLDDERQRPVLVMTRSSAARETPLDPVRTARRLAGLAHVVVLNDSASTYALAEALGGELAVYEGAARLYWPGLRAAPPQSLHPLWLPERLTAGGGARWTDRLFARLGRLSALTLGPPALEAQLRREADRERRAAADERLASLTEQYNEALRELDQRGAAAQQVAPEDVPEDDWFAEHERVTDELEKTANDRDELQLEVDRLTEELATAQENIKAMALATPAAGTPLEDDDETDEEAPASVLRAVERASETCVHLVLLPEAFASAEASQYQDAARVLSDLEALDRVAARCTAQGRW